MVRGVSWCVVCHVWCVVCHVWCVVCHVWCVVCHVWCVYAAGCQLHRFRSAVVPASMCWISLHNLTYDQPFCPHLCMRIQSNTHTYTHTYTHTLTNTHTLKNTQTGWWRAPGHRYPKSSGFRSGHRVAWPAPSVRTSCGRTARGGACSGAYKRRAGARNGARRCSCVCAVCAYVCLCVLYVYVCELRECGCVYTCFCAQGL